MYPDTNPSCRYEKYLYKYSYTNNIKNVSRYKESYLFLSTSNREARRPFSHRVHTICRPYEKTGRPVRCLRIPCGLLKQLSSLLLSSPSLPRSYHLRRRRGPYPFPRAQWLSLSLSRIISSRPGNYLSPFLSFSLPSLIENRCDSELSKRVKGQSAARRSSICHYHDWTYLNPFHILRTHSCQQSI